MSINSNNPRQSGFSLFELLMSVAILGVMGSMVLFAIGNQTDTAREICDRRNAQEIANVCSIARAAGVSFVAANDLDQTISKVIQGVTPSSGTFKNFVLKVNLTGEADVSRAKRFLEIKNGELIFRNDA